MLTTSANYKTYVREGGHTQQITGYIRFADSGTMDLSNEDFLGDNPLTIKHGTSRNDTFDVGIASMRTMSCTLNNYNGRFSSKNFYGAVFYLKVGIITTGETIEWINNNNYIGRFTVDAPVEMNKAIQITAVDDMYLFERPWSSTDVQASVTLNWETLKDSANHDITVAWLLDYICDACNVSYNTPTVWLNSTERIYHEPFTDSLTYRDVLGMICQITGTFAYINWEYKLCLGWYATSYASPYYLNAVTYDSKASILLSVKTHNDSITITGLEYRPTDSEENDELIGTNDGTVVIIENNLLLSSENKGNVLTNLSNRLLNYSFVPYKCEAVADFSIECGDPVIVVDRNSNVYPTILSNVEHKVRGTSVYSGDAKTSMTSKTSSYTPISKIRAIADQQAQEKLTNYEQMAFEANTKFYQSPAFYETTEYNADGSIATYYQHNAPTIADSTYITKFTAGYIGFSNTKINGVPQYTTIITGSGATIEHLAAKIVVAELIKAGSITSLDGKTFFNLNTAEIRETATINGKTVVVTLNPTDGFKITVDGVNVFYIGTDGTLYSASTITGSQVYTGAISSVGDFLKVDLDNEELLFGDTNGQYHKIKYTEGFTNIVYTSYQSSAELDWEFKRASGDPVKLGIFGDISLRQYGNAIEWLLAAGSTLRAELRTDAETSNNGGVDFVF